MSFPQLAQSYTFWTPWSSGLTYPRGLCLCPPGKGTVSSHSVSLQLRSPINEAWWTLRRLRALWFCMGCLSACEPSTRIISKQSSDTLIRIVPPIVFGLASMLVGIQLYTCKNKTFLWFLSWCDFSASYVFGYKSASSLDLLFQRALLTCRVVSLSLGCLYYSLRVCQLVCWLNAIKGEFIFRQVFSFFG